MATIGIESHGRSMTLPEFLAADTIEGYRYELVRGILFAEDVPDEIHGQVVSNLYQLLTRLGLEGPKPILRVGGGANFLLCLPDSDSALRPDVGVVLRGASKDHSGRRKPVLVAEVVSDDSVDRDLRIKIKEYLAYGILEYWIIDFLARKMTLLFRDADAWAERPCFEDRPIPSLVLPGLASTVADLWIDLDAYEEVDFDEEV